eukprot:TRINITY_DN2815_c0_g1_i5.p2 TRINITY_DN2815_c0_g1~~TRINITY_DN2815_c0_g1_i5.p2  ORF type:complete len:104 (-),score=26.36 TRINITY_DN2815_c0_g1_i5:168-479(-)
MAAKNTYIAVVYRNKVPEMCATQAVNAACRQQFMRQKCRSSSRNCSGGSSSRCSGSGGSSSRSRSLPAAAAAAAPLSFFRSIQPAVASCCTRSVKLLYAISCT